MHDNEKYDIFWTGLVEFAWFPECNCLMSSFLFTSCYDVMSSLTLILCLDNRTTRSETLTKTQCIFCWKLIIAKNFFSVYSQKFVCEINKFHDYSNLRMFLVLQSGKLYSNHLSLKYIDIGSTMFTFYVRFFGYTS